MGHKHPANQRHYEQRTVGERAADRLASVVGSWPFLVTQLCIIVIWVAYNGYIAVQLFHGHPFDAKPYILLNLCLSLQAAFTGPVLQLSGNRKDEKDRARSEADYQTNIQALEQIQALRGELQRLSDTVQSDDGDRR